MDFMTFLGQLSSVLWLIFLAIALVRIFITLKESRIFTPKN